MSPPDDRGLILARRARLAAALLGASVAGGACSRCTPGVCLEMAPERLPPASADAGPDPSADPSPSAGAMRRAPQDTALPCLSPAIPQPSASQTPRSVACLSVILPDRDGGH